jgi:hypothetical protein
MIEKKSEGFGDTVAKITKKTGIEKLTKMVYGEKDCGCKKRQEALNRAFPYKNKKENEGENS